MKFRLQTYDRIASTNKVVKEALAAGEAEGLAVCARSQTSGYGRQGRVWESPEGGMYLSLLLRPNVPMERLSTLSLVAGVAVRRALMSSVDGEQASSILLKWPNDIVVSPTESHGGGLRECGLQGRDGQGFAKLGGISLEALAGGVCVGIGVNVLPPANDIVLDGKNAPAYLHDGGFDDIDAVRESVLRELAALYDQWVDGGLAAFVEEINDADVLRGRTVRIANRGGEDVAIGLAQGIDEFGRLLVRTEGGVVRVSSGEAHVL